MHQVLAQLDLLRNLLAPGLQGRRENGTLHLPALNVELTVLSQDQTDYEGVKVEHPFQAYKNDVLFLPNELDSKVP